MLWNTRKKAISYPKVILHTSVIHLDILWWLHFTYISRDVICSNNTILIVVEFQKDIFWHFTTKARKIKKIYQFFTFMVKLYKEFQPVRKMIIWSLVRESEQVKGSYLKEWTDFQSERGSNPWTQEQHYSTASLWNRNLPNIKRENLFDRSIDNFPYSSGRMTVIWWRGN